MRIHTYKKIALNFLFLVFLLVGLIIYFIFYKVEIHITPVKEKVSVDFSFEVSGEDSELKKRDNIIEGDVLEGEVEGEKEFSSSGTKKVFEGSVGSVFIVNKEGFDQPLIATTRVLTADNILFRIKTGVIVPANGEIETEVYADDKNFKGVIKPTKLTIPGLSKSLQKTIYAENRENLGETKTVKIVSQEDINVARETLTEELYNKAKDQFDLKSKNKINLSLIGRIPKIKEVSWKETVLEKVNKEVGSLSEDFELYLKIKAIEISFDENKIYDLAILKLKEAVPDDKEFIEINKNSLNYVVEEFDVDKKIAKIKIYASGEMIISEDNKILDKNVLTGEAVKESQKRLESSPSIYKVEIKTPFNLFKFIPKNKNKIKIIIQD